MKGGFGSIETVYEFLSSSGIATQLFDALLALLLTACALLLLFWLFVFYRSFRIRGGLRGTFTRRKVKSLRDRELINETFTFANAVELNETGTIRKKPLENIMATCVVPVEMMFASEDHGLYYQFELGQVTKTEVMDWLEVTKALELAEISKILEETVLMHDVICHPDFDAEAKQGSETLGRKLWKRASELNAKMEEIDGIAKLRTACENHLRRHAPEMLPLKWS